MEPVTLALGAAQALYGAYNAIDGASKAKKAEKDARAAIANRKIPQVSETLKAARDQALTRAGAVNPAVAMAQRSLAGQVADGQAAATRQSTSGAGVLGAADIIQNAGSKANTQLAAQQAEFEEKGQDNLMRITGALAEDEARVRSAQLQQGDDNVNFNLGVAGAANTQLGQSLAMITSGLGTAAMSNTARERAGITPGVTTAATAATAAAPVVPGVAGVGRVKMADELSRTWAERNRLRLNRLGKERPGLEQTWVD